LTNERVQHVNRIKGLLFCQGVSGYKPLRRDRRRRLDELRTGDSRPLSKHLKDQISRELDRLELLLEQIKATETKRDALLAAQEVAARIMLRRALSSGNNEIVSIPQLTHRRHDSFVDWVDGYVRKRADARRFSI
jgi:transposase